MPKREQKKKELRFEFKKMDSTIEMLEGYMKNAQGIFDYLKKECVAIETRVYTIEEMVKREVLRYLD